MADKQARGNVAQRLDGSATGWVDRYSRRRFTQPAQGESGPVRRSFVDPESLRIGPPPKE